MTREDLRVKLQVLLGEFQKEHKLDNEEIHTLATTFITLMYSDKPTRLIWYREMGRVAELIAQHLKEQGEMIMAALDLSDEEKEKLKQQIKAKANKKDKVEN